MSQVGSDNLWCRRYSGLYDQDPGHQASCGGSRPSVYSCWWSRSRCHMWQTRFILSRDDLSRCKQHTSWVVPMQVTSWLTWSKVKIIFTQWSQLLRDCIFGYKTISVYRLLEVCLKAATEHSQGFYSSMTHWVINAGCGYICGCTAFVYIGSGSVWLIKSLEKRASYNKTNE